MTVDLVKDLLDRLKTNPIIPCTNIYAEVFSRDFRGVKIVFLYDIGIMDLVDINKININEKKHIILNIDTLKGISPDKDGANFIRKYLNINIISSTSPKLISLFRKMGFVTMQSIHTLDTKSIYKGKQLVEIGKPDFVDIRPGILFPKSNILYKNIFHNIPIICSGFINNKETLEEVIKNGAKGITSSNKSLWNFFL